MNDTEVKRNALKIMRAIIALTFFAVGGYLLIPSAKAWIQGGFQILTSEGKGKDVLSSVFFAVSFVTYGVWELRNLVKKT